MNPLTSRLAAVAALLLCRAAISDSASPPRQRWNMDAGWRFHLGEQPNGEQPSLDTGSWRKLDVPHDWSIEGTFAPENPSGGAGGFSPLGVGWYRKSFRLPDSVRGKRVFVDFDGVFHHADVWLNGRKIGENENGYLGFACDATSAVRPGGENLLAVRADNSKQVSRWYTGSGIYRHVWLTVTDPLHVARWGTAITTAGISDERATVQLRATVRNDGSAPRHCRLVTRIVAPTGNPVASLETTADVPATGESAVLQRIVIPRPLRWDPATPRLYHAVSEVRVGDRVLDQVTTPFGIRTVRWDVHTGLQVNGRATVIKGVCLHHELGTLGAAAFDRAIERRLRIVKELGCNAVRLSHNPYSPELLDLCDRMGLLVFDEAFDKWHGFQADGTGWKESLRGFLQRDRNHPSVVIWSVGNEMTPHMYRHEGTELFRAMSAFVHAEEPSRPVTAALHPVRTARGERDAPLCEMAAFMDVISMNYQTRWYPRDHEQHPDQMLLGSEVHVHLRNIGQKVASPDGSGNQWFGTRDYATNHYFPYVAGQFVWAGFDYLGEARAWPSKGYRDALVNLCGFRKPFSYYQQSLYTDTPMVSLAVDNPDYRRNPQHYGSGNWAALVSHWNWPPGQKTLRVFTFTNLPMVELFLNGRSLGEKRLADFADRIIFWEVPNEPGTLKAVGKRNGAILASQTLVTTGKAARLQLIPDRTVLEATGQDLSHVTVRLVDAEGRVVPRNGTKIRFRVSGAGTLAGVDNGDLDSPESFRGNERELREGLCLAVLRTGHQPGTLRLTATADRLPEAALEFPVRRPVAPAPAL